MPYDLGALLNQFTPAAAAAFASGLRSAWPIVQETLRTIPQVYWAKRYATELYSPATGPFAGAPKSISRDNLRFFYPDWRRVAEKRRRGYRRLRQYGRYFRRQRDHYRRQYNFYHRRYNDLAYGRRQRGGWRVGA